jgi:hypothetical protein
VANPYCIESCCEDCLNARLIVESEVGQAVGLEHFSQELKKLSGEMYAHNQDEKARFYRDVAKLAQERSEEKRRHQKVAEEQLEHTECCRPLHKSQKGT